MPGNSAREVLLHTQPDSAIPSVEQSGASSKRCKAVGDTSPRTTGFAL